MKSASGDKRVWPIALTLVVVGAAVLGFVVVRSLRDWAKPNPEFPSLAVTPDPSLQGTVAYYDIIRSCVRIVAASGQPGRDVLCLTAEETFHPDHDTFGPLLAWMPDGRLAVTMFWWGETQAESEALPGWQKIVDVVTGAVEETPAADLPEALPSAGQVPGPDGERIEVTSGGGRVEIVLVDGNETRTLLSAEGNPDYWVKVPPTWSPDGRWIVVENGAGELLLITVDDPAVTRILATDAMSWLGWSGRSHIAVTGAEYGDT